MVDAPNASALSHDPPTSSLPPAKRSRPTPSSNPLEIKPLGNLLWRPSNRLTRASGLGNLAALPDELLLSCIFSSLEGEDLVKCAGVSRAFFAWSRVEGIWKGLYISKTSGRLLSWHNSWRSSYVHHFLRPPSIPSTDPLPTSLITTPTLHSDVLYQPILCASFSANSQFLGPSFTPSIPHISGLNLKPSDLPLEPCILTDLMTTWEAMNTTSPRRWTLPHLAARFPTHLFRAEATLTTLPSYSAYHDNCPLDESPLYLFDSEYVNKTSLRPDAEGFGLGDDYTVPECFKEDFFDTMMDQRPDYRWLIVGPERSGSTWHQDPNGTSAWNAVTVGSKAWIMFPPDVTPPGVFVSEDRAQVEAPLSLAEWFMSYYAQAKSTYGAKAKDPATRGKMREGICSAGEIFFVPSGWWHIVVNLEPAIAVTQNFVSRRELPAVLRFMKHRPEQVSGFKLHRPDTSATTAEEEAGGLDDCDENVEGVFEAFCEALRKERKDVAEEALKSVGELEEKSDEAKKEEREARKEEKVGVWAKVKEVTEEEECGGGFSFGFFEEGDDVEEEGDVVEA